VKTYRERLASVIMALRAAYRAVASGQGLVEYAAILGFVAACLVVAVLFLEPRIASSLNNVANGFH